MLHDFAGPYYIRTDPHSLAFGPVCKFVAVDLNNDIFPNTVDAAIENKVELWDKAVKDADNQYKNLSHNLLW